MKPLLYILFMLSISLTACDIDAQLPDCDYNARLEYWYVFTGTNNELPDYIDTMNEYLFDTAGILRQVKTLEGDSLLAHELVVPPGAYTLVSWGNLDGRSHIVPAVIGLTRLSEILLEHNDIATESTLSPLERGQGVCQWYPNTEPLYYATDILEVPPSGILRKRINTTHAHALLKVTAKWSRNAPANTANFSFTLRGTPAAACFDVADRVNTTIGYSIAPTGTIYCIPRMDETNLCAHRTTATMRPNRTLTADLQTYRYTDNTQLLFRIWAGNEPLIREVNLTEFFRQMSISFSRNIRQEFSLLITIDGDDISVSFTGVSDWEDGGTIGGST